MTITSNRSLRYWGIRILVVLGTLVALAIGLIIFFAITLWIYTSLSQRGEQKDVSRPFKVLGYRVEWGGEPKSDSNSRSIASRQPLQSAQPFATVGGNLPYGNMFNSRQVMLDENGFDQRSRELAQQISATPLSQRDEQKMQELRKLVNESFISKQETQEQRLAKLSEEVANTKKTLDNRKSNQTEIVERRMSELLGAPDTLSWNNEQRLSGFTAPATTYMELPPGSMGNSSVIPPAYGNYNGFVVRPNQPNAVWIPPSGSGTAKSTEPRMPVYNPNDGRNPTVMPKQFYPVPNPGPSVYLDLQSQTNASNSGAGQTLKLQANTPNAGPLFVPQDLRALAARHLEAIINLKNAAMATNPPSDARVEAMRLLLGDLEASWSDRSKEFQNTITALTKQIAELEKLNNREWGEEDAPLREAIENQIQVLIERKRSDSAHFKWMKDFERDQLAEFSEPRELNAQKASDEPKDKSADESVPSENK